jgi:hypothetical protein
LRFRDRSKPSLRPVSWGNCLQEWWGGCRVVVMQACVCRVSTTLACCFCRASLSSTRCTAAVITVELYCLR